LAHIRWEKEIKEPYLLERNRVKDETEMKLLIEYWDGISRDFRYKIASRLVRQEVVFEEHPVWYLGQADQESFLEETGDRAVGRVMKHWRIGRYIDILSSSALSIHNVYPPYRTFAHCLLVVHRKLCSP